MARRAAGDNEKALNQRLKELDPALRRERVAIVALARTLARTLDEGAGLSTAAVAREYRNALTALEAEQSVADDDDFETVRRRLAEVDDEAEP